MTWAGLGFVEQRGYTWMGLAEYCFMRAVSQDTLELSARWKEPLALLLCVVPPWLGCFRDGSRPPAMRCSTERGQRISSTASCFCWVNGSAWLGRVIGFGKYLLPTNAANVW